MNKVCCLCTCRGGRELSQPEFQVVSSLTPQPRVCAPGLGGLEGRSGGRSSAPVLLRAECDISPRWCSLWLTCPCFEPHLTDCFLSSGAVMLVFKLLPLTVILAYHVCSSLSAQPFLPVFVPPLLVLHELIVSSLQAKHSSGLLWFFIPCLFPAITAFLCSDRAGFSSSCHAHLACTPSMFIWELYSFTQSQKVNADSSLWSGK